MSNSFFDRLTLLGHAADDLARRRRRARSSVIEPLEARSMLTVGTFAQLAGATGGAGASRIGSADVMTPRGPFRSRVADHGRPVTVSVGLDPASDPDGNGIVTRNDFTIDGQTAPRAMVILVSTDGSVAPQVTRADARGDFAFQLNTGVGIFPFHFIAIARGGRIGQADLTVTRGDVILGWDQTLIDAIRADQNNVGLASRSMAMASAAMYDAVNDIERTSGVFKVDVPAPPDASPEAAASAAAYTVLLALYPDQAARLDATQAEALATVPDGPSKDEGIAVGQEVGAGILAWRADDGSGVQVPYTPGTAPGDWRPTPPDYRVAWGPEWGQVTLFAIPSIAPFMPPPPPPLDSDAYAAALNQVEALGALDSTVRTPEQTQIGAFWAYDSAAIGPPVVRFQQVAMAVALQQHNTLEQNARMFALADLAMADAGIVAWQAKYTYNRWRPITAIQLADTDGNPATVADPNWQPLGSPGDGGPNFTPPFPSYVSGHATFGGALFTTLADFYGTDNVRFTLGSDELPGVYRTYTSFSQASDENAMSRIYLGIHFSFDESNGQAAGDAIANDVFQNLLTPGSPSQ